jgi:hypothetical protein
METTAYSANGHPHDLGHLFIAKLLHFPENKGGSQFRCKLIQQLFNYDPVFHYAALVRLSRVKLDQFCAFEPQAIHA